MANIVFEWIWLKRLWMSVWSAVMLRFENVSNIRVSRWPSGLDFDRVVLGSNPAAATPRRNFGNSVYTALPVSFGGDNKSRRSLLSGIYARGSKISHKSALEMCNLYWTPPLYMATTSSRVRAIYLSKPKNQHQPIAHWQLVYLTTSVISLSWQLQCQCFSDSY